MSFRCGLILIYSVMYQRFLSMGAETTEINWKHAVGCLFRWQQLLREFCRAVGSLN